MGYFKIKISFWQEKFKILKFFLQIFYFYENFKKQEDLNGK